MVPGVAVSRAAYAAAVLVLGVITACVLESPTEAGNTLDGMSFELLGDSVIVVGSQATWDVRLDGADQGPSRLKWSSADSTVATVDANGVVRGVGAGRTDVTAHLTAPDIAGEVTRSRPIDVIYAGIVIDRIDSLTGLAEQRQLVARGLDVDDNPSEPVAALFSTLDTVVVGVSDSGVVVARGNGTATVRADYQEMTANIAVRVRQVAKAVRFEVPELIFPLLDRDTVVGVEVLDTQDSIIASPAIAWSSSDPTSVVVSDLGVIRATAVSSAVITARVDTAYAELIARVPQGVSFLERIAGNGQSGTVATMVPVPPTVTARNAMGDALSGVAVTFSVASGGGSITDSIQITTVDGTATLGSWLLGTEAGPNTVAVSAEEAWTVFTADATPGPPSTESSVVRVSSGEVAAGSVAVVTLEVRDVYGNPLSTGGEVVTFGTAGGTSTGSLSPVRDEADGTYTADFTGNVAGTATTVRATINGTTVNSAAAITVVPGPPFQVRPSAGDNQTAIVGTPVAASPSVVVRDAFDNLVSGATVSFAVTGGGGEVSPSPVISDETGAATATTWTLGSVAGPNALTATADNATFTFSAMGVVPSVADTVTLGNLLLGLEPYAIAVDPSRGRAYVANRSSDELTIVDIDSKSALARVVVGGVPAAVAVDSATGLVYVSSEGTNVLSVVDPVARVVDAAIPLGAAPADVAVNVTTSRVYVALPNSGQVAVIDATNNTVETTIGVGSAPSWLAVDAPSDVLYVSNTGDGTVSVVDMSEATVVGAPQVGTSPQGIAVDASRAAAHVATADGIVILSGTTINATISLPTADYEGVAVREFPRRLYVANATTGELVIANLSSLTVTATLSIGESVRDVAIDESRSTVLVTNPSQNTVPIVDLSSNTIAGAVDRVSEPRGVAVHADLNRVYVANGGTDNVVVMDAVTHAKLGAAIAVGGGPWGVAVNDQTDRLYVTNNGEGSLSVIDVVTGEVIATVTVGTAPRGVAVNKLTNRVYVANHGSNTVTVLEGGTNLVVATIAVGTKPTDVTVDEAANRIFVSHEADDLRVIDGVNNGVVASIGPLGGSPSAAVYDPRSKSVCVTNGDDPGVVWMVDAVNEKVAGSLNIAGRPLAAALVSGGTLVVPTSTAVHFLNTVKGSVAYSMFTGSTSLGVAVHVGSNKVFVADAGPEVNGLLVVQH